MKFKKALAAILLTGLAFAAGAQTTIVSGTRDFGGATVGTSCAGGNENQQPVILVRDGGVVRNVVLRSGAAADGIHCEGTCRLENVSWPKVCEDAATMLGGSGKTMTVTGGSAAGASDKIFQHNGVGSTVNISNFTVTGTNGKLYRSCGNCSNNGGPRRINVDNVTINGSLKSGLTGINKNFGDVATITRVRWKGWSSTSTSSSNAACITFTGVQKGKESPKLKPEWDTANCKVSKSNITAF